MSIEHGQDFPVVNRAPVVGPLRGQGYVSGGPGGIGTAAAATTHLPTAAEMTHLPTEAATIHLPTEAAMTHLPTEAR